MSIENTPSIDRELWAMREHAQVMFQEHTGIISHGVFLEPESDRQLPKVVERANKLERSFLRQHPLIRNLAIGTVALFDASMAVLGVQQLSPAVSEVPAAVAEVCNTPECTASTADVPAQGGELSSAQKSPNSKKTPETTAQTQSSLPNSLSTTSAEIAIRKVEIPADIHPEAAKQIGQMELSTDGFIRFLEGGINLSFFDEAQRYIEFNPGRVPINQYPTEFITLHFTNFYRNEEGQAPNPVGKMAVLPFLQGIAGMGDQDKRPDKKCCAINALVDREGQLDQFAPFTAKLRHNKGKHDGKTTGLEFEGSTQEGIKTIQYEKGAYWLIANWRAEENLRNKPFSSIIKGHAETRKEEPWVGHRSDFETPATEYYRQSIQAFIDANPEILNIPVNLR